MWRRFSRLPKQAACDQQGNSHGVHEARGFVNRRIAVALILTLLAQSFLPGIALAWRAEPWSAQTLVICTGDGVKRIPLDPGKQDDQPRAQPCCPCAIPCGACVPSGIDRVGARIVYAKIVPLRLQPEWAAPIAARAPPAHQSRAPPSLS
jgi:hypothetical protein